MRITRTAVATDPSCIFEGYSHGAVDYLVKPFAPDILRAKVSVFVDLWKRGELIKRQESLLRAQERRELERRNEVRFRAVTESIPACVWVVREDGAITYANRVWHAYAGDYAPNRLFGAVPVEDPEDSTCWAAVVSGHPQHGPAEQNSVRFQSIMEPGEDVVLQG